MSGKELMPENVLRRLPMVGAGGIRRMRGTSGSSSSLSSLSIAESIRRPLVAEGLMPSHAEGGARSGESSPGVWPMCCAA